MIGIVDYGMGNLRSVEKALHHLGHAAVVSSDPQVLLETDRLILPGVGAFGAAMANLERPPSGREPRFPTLADVVCSAAADGRPGLGICLGMQLFLSESEEWGRHRGLDLLRGEVVRFQFEEQCHGAVPRIPHMGWTALRLTRRSRLMAGVEDGAMVYFVHSYLCRPRDTAVCVADAEHGRPFCAAMEHRNLFATQFHPEKSGAAGMRILDNFARAPVEAEHARRALAGVS